MTSTTGERLVVDAEIRRGDFEMRINFEAAPGQVLGVLGPNGAGKSTLLRALAGLTPIAAGRVTLGDLVLDDAESGTFIEPSGRPVGLVFQDYRLFPHLDIRDNVAFGPQVKGVRRALARKSADQWLARCGILELADRRPSQISGGEAQRVALARALAAEPSMLLLDEPLGALDVTNRVTVQAELRSLLSGFAGPSLLVTHDPLDALTLADQLLVIEDGVIVQQGTVAQVTRQPATTYVAKLVGLNLYQGVPSADRVDLPDGGTLRLPDSSPQGPVLVAIRPSSVVVSTVAPENSSARNTWQGVITAMSSLAGRVRLDITGRPSIVAEVTAQSVAEMGLSMGDQVWCSVKATEIEVYQDEPLSTDGEQTSSRVSLASRNLDC